MKNIVLAIASILTTFLLFTQTAFASQEGGAVQAGENVTDESVPGAQGAGTALIGLDCPTCRTHASGAGRTDHTNPAAAGTQAKPTAPSEGLEH
jgi:hypothetical protein